MVRVISGLWSDTSAAEPKTGFARVFVYDTFQATNVFYVSKNANLMKFRNLPYMTFYAYIYSMEMPHNGQYSGQKCLFLPQYVFQEYLISSLFFAGFYRSITTFDRAKRGKIGKNREKWGKMEKNRENRGKIGENREKIGENRETGKNFIGILEKQGRFFP